MPGFQSNNCGQRAAARLKIARRRTKAALDGNWSSFQLAKSTPPQGVIDRAIAPSARMPWHLQSRAITALSTITIASRIRMRVDTLPYRRKIVNSHKCAPITATFSKRRKIGSL